MPTYEYKCSACGYEFERFHSITAEPIKRCPECGKAKVKRLLGTGAGLIFKGSGFYITDYRSEGYKNAAKAEAGGGTSSDSKSGESKPSAEAAGPKGDSASPAKAESKPPAEKPSAEKPAAANPPATAKTGKKAKK